MSNCNVKKLKVMTIVGTRPELIKLARVIAELDKHTDHILVHSGQNYAYELNEVFFKDLAIRKPDYFLEAVGDNLDSSMGLIIEKTGAVLDKELPDAVLYYGDTNTCLGAIAVKRKQIPLFHMEAGNRCFDQRVPEESNRKIIDHLSDINMPLTEHARRYLIQEGLRSEQIIKIGSCMQEVLNYYHPDIDASTVLDTLSLQENQYFIVSMHREENVDSRENLSAILNSLNEIALRYQFPVYVSVHPRTKKRLEEVNLTKLNSKVIFMTALGFCDYVKLQKNAFCVISDSGTITEESSLLNFPAITIRNAHERPEGMDEGVLIMSGLRADRVLQSIEVVTQDFTREKRMTKLVPDYDIENVSRKVVKIIYSYVDYVNRVVWRKFT